MEVRCTPPFMIPVVLGIGHTVVLPFLNFLQYDTVPLWYRSLFLEQPLRKLKGITVRLNHKGKRAPSLISQCFKVLRAWPLGISSRSLSTTRASSGRAGCLVF